MDTQVELEPLTLMYNDEAEDLVLCGDPDYVIDAIDNTDTKVSECGAGNLLFNSIVCHLSHKTCE